MKTRLSILTVAIFVGALGAAAQEPDAATLAAATELLKAGETEALIEESYESALESQVSQFRKMGMNDATVEELKKEMMSFFKEVMPYSELEPELVRLYATSFTESELKELTAFHNTPTGKKAIRLMPNFLASAMKMGQERVRENMESLQKRIMPIIERGMQPQ